MPELNFDLIDPLTRHFLDRIVEIEDRNLEDERSLAHLPTESYVELIARHRLEQDAAERELLIHLAYVIPEWQYKHKLLYRQSQVNPEYRWAREAAECFVVVQTRDERKFTRHYNPRELSKYMARILRHYRHHVVWRQEKAPR